MMRKGLKMHNSSEIMKRQDCGERVVKVKRGHSSAEIDDMKVPILDSG